MDNLESLCYYSDGILFRYDRGSIFSQRIVPYLGKILLSVPTLMSRIFESLHVRICVFLRGSEIWDTR